MTKVLMTMGLPSDRSHEQSANIEFANSIRCYSGPLFDQDLYIEFRDERYGPYHPVGGPIPLHHYRQHRKGRREQRAETEAEARARVMALAREVIAERIAAGETGLSQSFSAHDS